MPDYPFRNSLAALTKRKSALEIALRDAIFKRVHAFEEETGVSISSINVELVKANAMGLGDELVSTEVRVSLDLDT